MAPTNKGIRGQWSQQNMTRAVEAVHQSGMSVNRASQTFNIPRRTLRRYLETNKENKSALGRKPILSLDQESELAQRIIRLSQVGYPLTPRILRSCVYNYTKTNNIKNPFRADKEMAGRFWLKGFLSRNPQIRPRKAQNLNPARAQKLNPFIVKDHFDKLEGILKDMDIIDKPERIYNIDEKGCRLCLHHQQKVLAQKGVRRVHVVGNEHGENVTIVSCGNAMGVAIPPIILFKGKRLKQEWKDNLPPGSDVLMTTKGSMTASTFCSWLEHFAKYKVAGPCLLIFDGAKCHLDFSIVEKASMFDITLYCLPSNTTHELQPMDKAVFRAFEYYWDDEVIKYLSINKNHSVTKHRFGAIFSKVWDKALTPANIKSGFAATGIYPFNKDAIPEIAFAPSTVTNQDNVSHNESECPRLSLSPKPSTSGLQNKKTKRRRESSDDSSDTGSDTLLTLDDDDDLSDANSSDSNMDNEGTAEPDSNRMNVSFQELLNTPDETVTKRVRTRKPALNCKAQVVTKDLFQKETNPTAKKSFSQEKKRGNSQKNHGFVRCAKKIELPI